MLVIILDVLVAREELPDLRAGDDGPHMVAVVGVVEDVAVVVEDVAVVVEDVVVIN